MNFIAESAVDKLLFNLAEKGIQVACENGNLTVRSMVMGLITPEIKRTLSRRKPEIVKALQINRAAEEYRQKGFLKIYSCYLDQEIYLAKNKKAAEKIPNKKLSVYLEDEMKALGGLSIEELKTLHAAKRIFGGMIFCKK